MTAIVKRLSAALALLVMMIGAGTAGRAAPLDYFLEADTTYESAIPTPESVLGHELGSQPVRHDLMVRYIRALGKASDRLSVETIGYSHENRPILFITVTSPDNRARLDTIRANHLKRTDPASADQASDDLPVVTWLNYGVHGAEASGMDAAIPTLYHLAAAQGERITATLDNSVILITAIFNPDGHARRAAWVTSRMSKITATDPADEVHNARWPGGRTNHYWFDLNRQWLLQTQPESRAWLSAWHKWKPHVSADFHEMGPNSTYYFHPGVPARKYPLIPDQGRKLLHDMADFHADALDAADRLYFSEEGFDNFYIGKGSTYPQVNGGLGILFEAGGQMGIARDSDQGLKTYADNVRKHYLTSLSTIRGAASMRQRLHAYQAAFFQKAAEQAGDDKIRGVAFRAPENPTRLARFIDLMGRHGVRVHRLSEPVKTDDGRRFEAGSYVIPYDQPQYLMAKAVTMRITDFPENIFYDVSGWTLPLAYNLDHGMVRERLKGKLGEVASADMLANPTRSVAAPKPTPYAYVMSWDDDLAPRALVRLHRADIHVRMALRQIMVETEAGAVRLDRGALIVPLEDQTVTPDRLHEVIATIAETDGIRVHAVVSGRTRQPGGDLGGRNSVADLKPIKPLLVVGDGVSPYDAGEVWHALDVRLGHPLVKVGADRLDEVRWADYTHLIVVGGRGLSFGEDVTRRIRDWMHDGGTVVAHSEGAEWALEHLTDDDEGSDDGGSNGANGTAPRLAYEDKAVRDAEHVIGGAVFDSRVDITHPIGFGLVRGRVATNRNSTFTLPVPDDPYARVAVYGDEPLTSGYASDERLSRIAGTPAVTAQRKGRGSLILFADNPLFRATYFGSQRMFFNALFFSKAFSGAYGTLYGAH
ncbi:M14 family zinc carboxypeptidase [Yunchengibacter salinarum]|uniref:M14 family zinc carboxypeptidase n=1 Tax=Yunchengibacter salinarum TaxID=3133399 RepID=UPI0035B57F48